MATQHAPDPLAALLLRVQARLVECLHEFADGRGSAAIAEARRILRALLDAETQVLFPAFARVSLRLEAESLLETMRDERAQHLADLEQLAHKRAPRLRKLGAVALGESIHRHARQHSVLLVPVLASQMPRPLHRSIVQAFAARYEAALAQRPRRAESTRPPERARPSRAA